MDAVTVGGEVLGTLRRGVAGHHPKLCEGDYCPLHTQSRHHMRMWPQAHGVPVNLTVRTCPHGVHHPDPDDVRWGPARARHVREECDGCCTDGVR